MTAAQAARGGTATGLAEGLLVYAKGEDVPACHVVRRAGKTLHVRVLDLEKNIDLRYREQVSKELEDLGQVDDEREWNESLSENDEPIIDSRDFKDEVRILRGIESLLNQMRVPT